MAEEDHAPLGPSHSDTWMLCTASVDAERPFPNVSSVFADEGSAAHVVRAECLAEGRQPDYYLNDVVFGGERLFAMTRDRLEPLYAGIARIRELAGDVHVLRRRHPNRFLVEAKLKFSDILLSRVWGTVDFGAVVDDWAMTSDLKFGRGYAVAPEGNRQQLIYAALMLDNLDRADRRKVRRIRIGIDQPRMAGAGGEWVIEIAELERWIDKKLYPVVESIEAGEREFNPGEAQCHWCRAAHQCEARREFVHDRLGIEFEDEIAKPGAIVQGLSRLSPAKRSSLIEIAPMIRSYLDTLEAEALADALRGDPVPGFKAVYGQQGKRVWIDEAVALSELKPLLGEKASVTKVISPTQAEKALPRREFAAFGKLTRRGEASPILVKDDDVRPAIPPIVMEDERRVSAPRGR